MASCLVDAIGLKMMSCLSKFWGVMKYAIIILVALFVFFINAAESRADYVIAKDPVATMKAIGKKKNGRMIYLWNLLVITRKNGRQ